MGSAVVDFAFGSEPGRLNLKSVLIKVQEMYASLCRLEQDLQFDVNNKRWHQLIDLFSMIHLQYSALLEQFRDNLEYWAIYPKRVEQALAMKLQGGMISPKLLIELEQENEALLLESEKSLQDAQETMAHINRVVEQVGSGVLDPRGPLVGELLAEMRKDRKARANQYHTQRASAPKLDQMLTFMKNGSI